MAIGLRNAILQAAVQGKLTERETGDESIETMMNDYGVSPSLIVDVPYDIPEEWVWSTIGNSCDVQLGKMLDKQKNRGSLKRYLRNVNVQWGYFDLQDVKEMRFTDDELNKFRVSPGDLMVCEGGVPGRCAIWRNKDSEIYYQKALHRVRPLPFLLPEYVAIVIEHGVISGVTENLITGSTIKHLPARNLECLPIPIPSISEQQRIVAKLEELLPKVERAEALDAKRMELTRAFPDAMRASILQAAVQGELTERDADDESACDLLARVREERRELVKQKLAKVPKGGESIIQRRDDGSVWEKRGKGDWVDITEEIPFDIPEEWEWVRLEGITTYIQRGKSPTYTTIKKYPVVAQKCNQWSGFSLELAKFADPATIPSYGEERFLVDGDLLWNSTGLGTLGRMAVYDSAVNPYECAVADSHVTVIRTKRDWILFEYAFAYFAGPSVQSVIEDKASGSTKQKELSQETVKSYLIPIPPLAEQQRIVAKLEEMLPKVDRLVDTVSKDVA